jgi:hypothetical protein
MAGLWFAAAKLDGQEMLFVTAYPNMTGITQVIR